MKPIGNVTFRKQLIEKAVSRALSQEACAFVFDQALFDDEEVEALSIDGGRRIAAALGKTNRFAGLPALTLIPSNFLNFLTYTFSCRILC